MLTWSAKIYIKELHCISYFSCSIISGSTIYLSSSTRIILYYLWFVFSFFMTNTRAFMSFMPLWLYFVFPLQNSLCLLSISYLCVSSFSLINLHWVEIFHVTEKIKIWLSQKYSSYIEHNIRSKIQITNHIYSFGEKFQFIKYDYHFKFEMSNKKSFF